PKATGSCPRPAHSGHPTAHKPRGGDPGVLGEEPLSRLTPPRPSGEAQNAAAALGCLGRPFAATGSPTATPSAQAGSGRCPNRAIRPITGETPRWPHAREGG